MHFCPKCNNIMDIARTPPKVVFAADVTTVSADTTSTVKDKAVEQKNDGIAKVINMYNEGIDISGEKIDVDVLVKHPLFVAMKEKEKQKLLKAIRTIEDESFAAYMVCKNCSYYEKLTKRTNVLNRMNTGSVSNYNNLDRIKNMKHDKTLPITTDYVCRNKTCNTHKHPELRRAKWVRPTQHQYNTYYICTICDAIWSAS